MKYCRYIIAAVLLACLVLGGVACSDSDGEVALFYTVTFKTGGGSTVKSMRVQEGGLVPVPPDPTKEGYVFNGWRDSNGAWIFEKYHVYRDMTLEAVWIDAKSLFEWKSENEQITITGYKGDIVDITVPDMMVGLPVTTIADGAFENISSESAFRITLGENVVNIGDRAFADCNDIEIIIKGELEQVGEQAFLNCNMLTEVRFGTGADYISYEAFKDCTALETVYLSDTLREIGENAFDGCTALTRLVAYSSLKTICDSAFVDCDALAAVFYYGTAQEWQSTDISYGNFGNDALLDVKFYIYSETEPQDTEQEYWHYDTNGKFRVW